jgi:glutamate--cysteine ligase
MEAVFSILDSAHDNNRYTDAYRFYRSIIDAPEQSPSARIITEMRDTKEAFFPFSMRYSQQHADYFSNYPLNEQQNRAYQLAAQQSIEQQEKIEQETQISFEQFLDNYFSQR